MNDAAVIQGDILVSNGRVHLIDRVLLPPAAPAQPTMAAFLAQDGRFSTLIAAAETAGILDLDALETFPIIPEGSGYPSPAAPHTLFAPTDEAFAKLPAGTVETLLMPENRERLTQILLHHLVPAQHIVGVERVVELLAVAAVRRVQDV